MILNKLKYQSDLFNLKSSIIEENGKLYQVEHILNEGDSFFSQIHKRALVLLLCQNKFESIFFYINAICRGVVPILIDSKTDSILLINLIEEYQPDFIFLQESEAIIIENYYIKDNFRNYKLLKCINTITTNLHQDLALLLSTSGTTGSPKLVRLTLENLVSNSLSISKYLNLNPSEVAITSLPMNYSFGLSIINSHLFVGASIVITNESISQRNFWDLFKKYNVTSLSGVPYTFEILKKFRLLNSELPSLKTLTQAGGKLSNEYIEYFANFSQSKGINLFIMYGQTEGTARLSYLTPKYLINKLGSIGKPIPNGDFYLIDENGVKINEPNKSGELIYTGKNVMLGYAETRNDLINGDFNKGVLKTGDIAFFDEDGFYFIVGRIKRFIKIFGNRINLDEIEKLLLDINIENACVGRDGLLIVYVVKNENINMAKDFINKKLSIHLSAFQIRVIDTIPKNSSGKTLYSKLQDT